MGYFDNYKPYIWDNLVDDSAKIKLGESIFAFLAEFIGSTKYKEIDMLKDEEIVSPEGYLNYFSSDDLGFVEDLVRDYLKSLNNDKDLNPNGEVKDFHFLENIVAFLAVKNIWESIRKAYPGVKLDDNLKFKEYEKDFNFYLFEGENDWTQDISSKIKINKVKSVEESDFISEFEKVLKFKETLDLKLFDYSVLTEKTKKKIRTKIDSKDGYIKKLYSPCFEDIVTYIITPSGCYGNVDIKNPLYGQNFLCKIDALDDLKELDYRLTNMSINYWDKVFPNRDKKLYNAEYKYNDNWEAENSFSDAKVGFPLKFNAFKKWFIFPHLQFLFTQRSIPTITKGDIGISVDFNTLTDYSNIKDFLSGIKDFYEVVISELLTNFLTENNIDGLNELMPSSAKDKNEYRLLMGKSTVGEGNVQDSPKSQQILDGIIEGLLLQLLTVFYTYADVTKNENMLNIRLVGFANTYSGDASSLSTVLEKGFLGMKQSASFKDLYTNVGMDNKFSNLKYRTSYIDNAIYTGIFSLNMDLEKSEILFAYKKYDKLFYNNIPLSSNVIIGRDESTYKDVRLPLDVPQNIVTSIIAGSGSGKGVLTLAILANLFVSEHPVIYADFKPDMAATLWDMSTKAQTPIYSIDGKGLSAGKITPENVPYPIIDESGNPVKTDNWYGYDGRQIGENKSNLAFSYLSSIGGAVEMLPYLKTMQLFVAFGLARKSQQKSFLKKLPKSDGSIIADNENKMFIILDEAQMANTIYDGVITEIESRIKQFKTDKNTEGLDILNRYKSVFVNTLAKDMKDIVITTGRVSKMGIIMIGQQTDPGQWTTPQGSWKECTFGYMLGNSALKLIGKNGGTSPTYGMPKAITEDNQSLVGKELGYWALSTQVRSGEDKKAVQMKTYLILNENDYNPVTEKGGSFTSGLFSGNKSEEDIAKLKLDLTSDEDSSKARENVGFDGMLKQFLNTSASPYETPDDLGYSQNYRDKLAYTYYLFEGFLRKAGIVGEGDCPYPNLFSYLFSVNPDYFLTANELFEAFKTGRIKQESENQNGEKKSVYEFFSDFECTPVLDEKTEKEIETGSVVEGSDGNLYPLRIDYNRFINGFNDIIDNFYETEEKNNQKALKEAEDALKKFCKDRENPNFKLYNEQNEPIDLNEEQKRLEGLIGGWKRAMATNILAKERAKKIYELIKKETTEEKFNSIPIQPEYVFIKSDDLIGNGGDGKVVERYTTNFEKLKIIVDDTFNKNKSNFTSFESRVHSDITKCLKSKDNVHFIESIRDGIKLALDETNEKGVLKFIPSLKEQISSSIVQASPEHKKEALQYIEDKKESYINSILTRFDYCISEGVPFSESVEDSNKGITPTNTSAGYNKPDIPETSDTSDASDTSDSPVGFNVPKNSDSSNEDLNEKEKIRQEKLNRLYSVMDGKFEASFKDVDLKINSLETKQTGKKSDAFVGAKKELLTILEPKYCMEITSISKFFTDLEKYSIENSLKEEAKKVYNQKYSERFEQYRNQVKSMEYQGEGESAGAGANGEGGKGGPPAKQKGKISPATFNGQTIASDIDTGDMEYNTRKIDSMGNVKASRELTNRVIRDIKDQFGGVNNIDEITVNAGGSLIINGYGYAPKFGEAFMNSLGLAIKSEVQQGRIGRVVNLGQVVAAIMGNIFTLAIECPKTAMSDVFQAELGVRNGDYGRLFKNHRNLQTIYLPDQELTRDNPNQQRSGTGLGAKLAGLFGFGRGNRDSDNYVPNTATTNNGNSFIDQMYACKPVRILANAFGWTAGCQLVYLAATMLGPWGLVFGAFAAAGAYKEAKNGNQNNRNSGYSTNSRSGGSTSSRSSGQKSKNKKSNDFDE